MPHQIELPGQSFPPSKGENVVARLLKVEAEYGRHYTVPTLKITAARPALVRCIIAPAAAQAGGKGPDVVNKPMAVAENVKNEAEAKAQQTAANPWVERLARF